MESGLGAPVLEIQGVNLFRGEGRQRRQILSDCQLQLHSGRQLAIMGDSGAGKSTLLHLIAGLERPDSGSLKVAGQPLEGLSEAELSQYRKSIGLVFQQFNLLPTLSVRDNILFQHRLNRCNDETWVLNELAAPLGLTELLDYYPDQLSGGEQQRVAIARALAHRPKLVLADEPTGNLDEGNSAEVMALLAKLSKQFEQTLVVVTHSPKVAEAMDQCLFLRQGKLHD